MIRFAASLALLVLLPALASGQTVTLTISGANVAMQNPTLADYDAGFVIDATPLTWTATVNSPKRDRDCTYNVTVQVRASSNNIGNSKSISNVRWSNGGAPVPLTQTYATIGTAALNRSTPSRSGSLTFRILLNWTESNASFTGSGLQFQVLADPIGSKCD